MNRKKISLITGSLLTLLSVQGFTANVNEQLFIGGYSSFEWEQQIEKTGRSDRYGSFDADLFDLVIAYQASDKVRMAADLTWEHGAASEEGLGNVAVEYAYPEYAVSNEFKIRAGKMFTHFGIYNEIHTAKPAFLTVKEPLSTNKPDKFGSADGIPFFPRWQSGLAFLGDIDAGDNTLTYMLQVSNGDAAVRVDDEFELVSMYDKDVDHAKAINGRVIFTTEDDQAFALSAYYDNMSIVTGEDYEPLTDVSQISNSIDDGEVVGNLARFSLSFHSTGYVGDVGYEVEIVHGILDGKGPEGNPFYRERLGTSAMVYYPMAGRYTPYIRHEFLEPDMDADDDIAQAVSTGVNIRLDANLFLKTEYRITRAGEENDRFSKGRNEFSELLGAVAFGF